MNFKVVLVYVCLMVGLPGIALARELPDFADLIEDKSPAVVKITTSGTSQQRPSLQMPDGQEIPPELFKFFPRESPERNIGGMGSGFIISKDGYVLTNNHVVDGMDKINVRLSDRREYTAEVIGKDARSDLALIKIDAKDLPFLKFADSDKLRVGEWVFAIGSPFGMDFSASQGIISAMGRSIFNESNENYVPFIQTDVAINPGNSGGPLFNLDGLVVGINSQIYTRSGGYMGLSFAIPANVAIGVIEQLKDKGRVDRGWLGVEIRDLDRDMAEALGLRKPQGALVNRLFEGGPADKAGLKSGDVIMKFDGRVIGESGELPHVVGVTTPGKTVPVEIMREKKQQTIRVEVGTLASPSEEETVSQSDEPSAEQADRLGVVVKALEQDVRDTLEVAGGVEVTQVKDESAGAKAGLMAGDIIVQIGFQEITSLESYQQLLAALPTGDILPIRFFRDGQAVFRTITLTE